LRAPAEAKGPANDASVKRGYYGLLVLAAAAFLLAPMFEFDAFLLPAFEFDMFEFDDIAFEFDVFEVDVFEFDDIVFELLEAELVFAGLFVLALLAAGSVPPQAIIPPRTTVSPIAVSVFFIDLLLIGRLTRPSL
jgi:hypothetical protein